MAGDYYDDDFDDSEPFVPWYSKYKYLFLVAGILIAVGLAGARMLRGAGGQAGAEKTAARLTLKNAEELFNSDPTNADSTAEAVAAFEAAGDHAKAEEIKRRHDAAVASKGHTAELALRDRLARNPKDAEALSRLLDLLTQSKRTEDARIAYADCVKADPRPQRQAGYGAWLWRNGYAEEAEKVLRAALAAGDKSPHAHGYLGLALFDLGKKDEAKKELETALDGDPDQDLVRAKLVILDPEEDSEEEKPAPPPKASHHKAKRKRRK